MTLARSSEIMHRRRLSKVWNTWCIIFFVYVVVAELHNGSISYSVKEAKYINWLSPKTYCTRICFLYCRYILPEILQMDFHVVSIIYAAEFTFETIFLSHIDSTIVGKASGPPTNIWNIGIAPEYFKKRRLFVFCIFICTLFPKTIKT